VRTFPTRGAARLAAVLAGLAVIVTVPVALGADSTTSRSRAAQLHTQSAATGTRAHATVLNLYALESELSRARADVAAVEARRRSLALQRASTRRQLTAAKHATLVSERQLAELVRALYEQNGADPLAIVLGADSLDEALTGLDSLSRAAVENRRVLEQAKAARGRLARIDRRLAQREADLGRVARAARVHARALEEKVAERAAYVAELRQRRGLSERKVSVLETQARAAERQSATLEPAQAAPARVSVDVTPSAPAPAAPSTSGSMTVSAVGYSLPGHTASGLPVGHGIVAVDPAVIPLGTRMYVPGYGAAVAADTGSAVHGAMIDLWFPTTAAALQWGRRTVTITLG
jgi:3D (Asp-Asp-Asp) domain-containing protein/septal ring factor EnvC (AmiA/AmiB activator)